MTVQVKVGYLTSPGSTGNFSVTGLPFQPTALILLDQNGQSGFVNGVQTWIIGGFGVASGPTARGCYAFNGKDNALNDGGSRGSSAHCFLHIATNSVITSRADFVSFNSDGFTLNFDTVTASGFYTQYMAIGGISAKAGTLANPAATGNQAITGVGFQPKALIIGTASTVGAGLYDAAASAIGFSDGTNHRAMAASDTEGYAGADCEHLKSAAQVIYPSYRVGILTSASLATFDADGFTLDWTAVQATAYDHFYLALGGDDLVAAVGTYTTPTAPGTKTVTGVGNTPAGVMTLAQVTTAVDTLTNDFTMNVGVRDSTTGVSCGFHTLNGNSGNERRENPYIDGTVIAILQTDGTTDFERDVATHTSLDADGWTEEYTAADATARPVYYISIGEYDLDAPTGLTATANGATQIDLAWTDNAVHEDNYEIERSLNGSDWSALATIAAGSTSYSDTTCTEGTLYYYRVRAVNAIKNGAYSNTDSDTTWLAAPTAAAAVYASTTAIDLTWTENSANEDDVSVERSATGAGGWSVIATLDPDTELYQDTGLTEGTRYFYRVRVTSATFTNSAYSSTVNAYTQLAAPTAMAGEATGKTTASLTWTENSANEDNVSVERSLGGAEAWAVIDTLAASTATFDDTGLTAGTAYDYRVRVTDAAAPASAYSGTATLRTHGGGMMPTIVRRRRRD